MPYKFERTVCSRYQTLICNSFTYAFQQLPESAAALLFGLNSYDCFSYGWVTLVRVATLRQGWADWKGWQDCVPWEL